MRCCFGRPRLLLRDGFVPKPSELACRMRDIRVVCGGTPGIPKASGQETQVRQRFVIMRVGEGRWSGSEADWADGLLVQKNGAGEVESEAPVGPVKPRRRPGRARMHWPWRTNSADIRQRSRMRSSPLFRISRPTAWVTWSRKHGTQPDMRLHSTWPNSRATPNKQG